ncbi:patatin-like phospholipase domain-containing protein 4 isoform X1 [Argonauta hians]
MFHVDYKSNGRTSRINDKFSKSQKRKISLDNEAFDLDYETFDEPVMNLSFCGCGFLGIYQLGVAYCLSRHGSQLLSKVNRIAGCSAGSLIGAVLSTDEKLIPSCVKYAYDLADEARSQPLGAFTPKYSLSKSLEKFLNENLPHNAHEMASGRLFVSVTNVESRRNETFSHYSDREELVQSLLASCYIPLYSGGSPPVIRGKKYIDGGWTNNLLSFKEGKTIYVSPFSGWQDICPADSLGRAIFITMKEQTFQVNWKNFRRFHQALFPPSKSTLRSYFLKGQMDTERYLRKQGLYESHKPQTPVATPQQSSETLV